MNKLYDILIWVGYDPWQKPWFQWLCERWVGHETEYTYEGICYCPMCGKDL